MPTFVYEAMDSQGKEVKAEIDAGSEQEAVDKIKAQNFFPSKVILKGGAKAATPAATPTSIKRRRGGFSLSFRVSQKGLTAFTRQFATLMDAGLPIVRSLDILHTQLRPGILKDTLGDVKEDVEGGSSLSEALAKHPTVFDKLFVNMV